jgi:hypothetical protein
MTPLHARTWSPRGRTPVVRVRGRSRRRVSIAALTWYKPGHRSRLMYRPRRDDGQRDGRKSFSWRDYRDLLTAAHQQCRSNLIDGCLTETGPTIQPACRQHDFPFSDQRRKWS